MTATLASIHIFPLKSGAPLPLDDALVTPRGLRHDRRWMVVDARGRCLTGREQPRLTLVRATPRDDGTLDLHAPGLPALHLQPDTAAPRIEVEIWRSQVAAQPAAGTADAWIERHLGVAARFACMDEACLRPVDPDHSQPGDIVSFADGYPLLLVSQAALDELNRRLAVPVPMPRFRPNLVVAGTGPHAEDGWKRVRIGGIDFDVVKTCIRCVFTTVDFERGEFDPDGEPLRTLIGYRRTPKGVAFGQNLIPRGSGTLQVGDAVEVLA